MSNIDYQKENSKAVYNYRRRFNIIFSVLISLVGIVVAVVVVALFNV